MTFPTRAKDLEPRGYKPAGDSVCKGCGQKISWFITPRKKKIPMNPMDNEESEAIAHWTTCTEAPLFRKLGSAGKKEAPATDAETDAW